jgi:hypothetical protein
VQYKKWEMAQDVDIYLVIQMEFDPEANGSGR